MSPLPAPVSALPCACLSNIYLALYNLQSMKDYDFPSCLTPLRAALVTAGEVLDCAKCLHERLSIVQNVFLLGTLLLGIADRLQKAMESIKTEAVGLERSGMTKKFHLGNASAETSCFQGSALTCPESFCVDLDAQEWRHFAVKALKAEVVGAQGPNLATSTSLLGVISRMEERQAIWHANQMFRECIMRTHEPHDPHNAEEFVCLRLAREAKVIAQSMNL